MSHIAMIQARDVCPGMIFSTDGYKVFGWSKLESGQIEIAAEKSNHIKVAIFEPTKDLPIWVED